MSDEEVRQKSGDAAVAAKRAAEQAGDKLKEGAAIVGEKAKEGAAAMSEMGKRAYDDAAAKGRQAMDEAGGALSDAALKAKMAAGFKLVAGLDASGVTVDARQGKVYLSGTVPTLMDKMKAEGVAYGVTGDTTKFESKIEVKGKE